MDDIYEDIGEYNPDKGCKILVEFDNMIPNILSNKNLQQMVTKLCT